MKNTSNNEQEYNKCTQLNRHEQPNSNNIITQNNSTNESIINQINEQQDTLSIAFKSFIYHLESFQKQDKTYSIIKNEYITSEANKNEILLAELYQFSYKNPLEALNPFYIKDNYSPYILAEEIKTVEKIISQKAKDHISKKQEKLIFNKKILDAFLFHYVNDKFSTIISSLNKLYLTEFNIKNCLETCIDTRLKLSRFKTKVINNQIKYLLLKQKVNNMSFIKNITENILLPVKKKLDVINNKPTLCNLSLELVNEVIEDLNHYIFFFRKKENVKTVHIFILLEKLELIAQSKLKAIKEQLDFFAGMIFETDLEKYLEFFILFMNTTKGQMTTYFTVS